MKIMICGSMAFAKEMQAAQAALRAVGHEVQVPCDTDSHVSNPALRDDLETDFKHCLESDVMRKCFDLIGSWADAVVVLNYPKNGLDGYIGTSTLMEMGLAYYLRKKIYLLFAPPTTQQARWAHEVRVFQPTVLEGDLTKVIMNDTVFADLEESRR